MLKKGLLLCFLLSAACSPQEEVLRVEEEKTVSVQKMILEADEYFAFDSAELTDAAKSELNQVASSLRLTNFPAVFVTGHSDYLGTSEFNRSLSLKRAENVANYLKDKAGLLEGSVIARGVGFSRPVVDCFAFSGEAEKACLAPNRRVEIVYTATSLVETDTVTVVRRVREGLDYMTIVEQSATQRVAPIGE